MQLLSVPTRMVSHGLKAASEPLGVESEFRLEKAGLISPGLTLYGLRHTVAVILREAGCDERTIADALGQKDTKDGPTLCEGSRPQTEDAGRRGVAGCRIEQSANKSCQTDRLKLSGFFSFTAYEFQQVRASDRVRRRCHESRRTRAVLSN